MGKLMYLFWICLKIIHGAEGFLLEEIEKKQEWSCVEEYFS